MRSESPGTICRSLLNALALLGLLTAAACSAQGKCQEGQLECDGACVAASDPDHCGACGKVCGGEMVCSKGDCAAGCAEGLVSCGRACVDTLADAGNCGACGRACEGGASCKAGRCVAVVPECKDRLTFQQSGAYDADLKVVTLSGKLTKNGAAVPSSDGDRGYLVFTNARGGTRVMTSFGPSGDATYRGEIFAGTYDVRYQPSGSCRSGGPLPCQSALLRKGVTVSESGALDLDAQTVTVSGKLTRNGAAVPDSEADRGYVVFALRDGGTRTMTSFGPAGEARYQGELFAGTYDVRYQPSGSCRSGGPLPCQTAPLRANYAIMTSGALDLDLKVVTLSGKLTKNGAAVPDSDADRGSLVFSLMDGGSRTLTFSSPTGEASYRGELVAGTYDVRYQPSGSCRSGGPLPCQTASLRARYAIAASGALDFDLKVVSLSGKLTKNGAAVPDSDSDRGSLVFSLLDGGARSMPSFGPSGEATYRGEVFAGNYDVLYQPSGSCRSGGALPCQALALRQKVAITQGGALDFDAKVVRVSGKLTENGARLADDTADRGYVVFTPADGRGRAMPSFGGTGEATFQGELFAGTYDVTYQPAGSCRSGGALPCQSAPLQKGIDLGQSGAVNLDAKTVSLSGTVTKNGAAVPDSDGDRGYVVFALSGGGGRAMPSFGSSGAATYRGEIFTGSYDVRYQPSGSCRSGGPLPCQTLLIAGCAPPPAPAD